MSRRRKEKATPRPAPGHETCAGVVRDELAKLGAEVTVSELRPLVRSPWTEAIECPHGRVLFYEPTSDQRAAWARGGVR